MEFVPIKSGSARLVKADCATFSTCVHVLELRIGDVDLGASFTVDRKTANIFRFIVGEQGLVANSELRTHD